MTALGWFGVVALLYTPPWTVLRLLIKIDIRELPGSIIAYLSIRQARLFHPSKPP